MQVFHAKCVIYGRKDDAAIGLIDLSIYNEKIPVLDQGKHRVTLGIGKERERWVFYQLCIELDAGFDIIRCWRQKTCGDRQTDQRSLKRFWVEMWQIKLHSRR